MELEPRTEYRHIMKPRTKLCSNVDDNVVIDSSSYITSVQIQSALVKYKRYKNNHKVKNSNKVHIKKLVMKMNSNGGNINV
ncbi:MAG: hypothetical protein E7166_03275 [Firmicutes bacterium]|nr:hypothetical protein [Bacillota bacterium]